MRKPQSLAEMQQMEKEDFLQVDDYLHQGELNNKGILRHLIRLADREVSWQGRENASSLREFWYNPVKVIMENAFPDKLAEWGVNKFNRRQSQYLSSVLSEMVKDPNTSITYRSLNILDDSRDRDIRSTAIEGDKVLFVEKDSAYRHLKSLAQVYQICVVSGSGYESTALIEDIAHELSHELEEDKGYTLYVMSDYDPNGFEIVEDFRHRCELLGIRFKEVERIGIYPEQVDDKLVETQKFPVPKDETAWMAEYGIEGKYGLEIEAVSEDMETRGRELRKVVASELEDKIDETKRYRHQLRSKLSHMYDSVAQEIIDEITGDLKTALRVLALDLSDIENIDGVEIDVGEYGVDVEVNDLGKIRRNRNRYLPELPEQGELHRRAWDVETDIAGMVKVPEPQTFSCKSRLKSEIKEAIDRGEFEIAEHIELEE